MILPPITLTHSDTDLSIINLSSYPLSEYETSILKKGLNFCPNYTLDKFELYKDLQLFIRKIILKKLYQKENTRTNYTPLENQALDQLITLLKESNTSDLIDSIDLPRILQSIEEPDLVNPITPTMSKLKKKNQISVHHQVHARMRPFSN